MNKERIKKILKDVYPYIIVILVVVLLRSFIITPAVVDGESMEPTLYDNNIILLNKLSLKLSDIKRNDIVVVDWNGEKIVKRVIGLPGEHIEYKNNNLYIDGILEIEDFTHADTADFKLEEIGYKTIGGDKYFVVGDNRPHSNDSRMQVGLVDKKDILGKVRLRIFPINKIKVVK